MPGLDLGQAAAQGVVIGCRGDRQGMNVNPGELRACVDGGAEIFLIELVDFDATA